MNFTPSKGNDKHTRVNSVAPLFESGMIWAPEQKFAEEVIEECAAFPNGDHDDLVDSMTQAVMRFRQGGLIGHPEDYIDEKQPKPKRVLLLMNKFFEAFVYFVENGIDPKTAKEFAEKVQSTWRQSTKMQKHYAAGDTKSFYT